MNEEELKKYFNVYTDCWKLFKKFSDPVAEDAFWEALIDEGDAVAEKYGKSEFAKKMIVVTMEELDRISRKKGQNYEI